MWILESKLKDLLFISFPGVICYFAFLLLHFTGFHDGKLIALTSLAILIIIDTGHVYTTAWRTYFYRIELKRTKLYLYIPILLILIFSGWHFAQIPYIWNFVFYATIYHYIRQNYGILKWYEKKNNSFHHFTGKIIYATSLIPLAAMHFRSNFNPQYYSESDFFFFPSEFLFNICVGLQVLTISYWFYCEYRTKKWELNRVLFITANTIMYSTGFFNFLPATLLLACFVMAHGLPYIFLMATSLRKTQLRFHWSFKKLSTFLLFFAFVLGGGEYLFEEAFLEVNNNYLQKQDIVMSLLCGLYLIPLFSHFIFDALIWKKSHPEAIEIFR
jgi:hypothetical protein